MAEKQGRAEVHLYAVRRGILRRHLIYPLVNPAPALVVPHDSSDWWLHGLFFNGSRTGFIGWGGNQSLRAILTRFAGSIHGATAAWTVAALLAAAIGLASAVLLVLLAVVAVRTRRDAAARPA
jgi:hypothetical protein